MNDDYNLDLEDEPIEPVVDEDDRYLLDEQETEDEAKRKQEEAEEARLQALVDRKLADRFVREPEIKPQPRQQEFRQSGPPVGDLGLSEHELINKLSEEITNDLATNPQEAVRKVLKATQAMTKQATESSAERANRMTIENYRASKRSDPVFMAVIEDFNAEVDSYTPQQLGRATPAELRKALELAEDSAVGRFYRKQLTDKNTRRAAEPPKYGGRSSGSGVATPTRLTANQKELVRMAKSAGLGEKAIRELVRDNK